MALTPAPAPGDAGPLWRLHATLPRSAANGPGTRFVVWVQGCSLRCPGCFNPGTHPVTGGTEHRVGDVVSRVLDTRGIDGVTVTGGEPLDQPEALASFVSELRRLTDLGVVVLTGRTRQEIEADPVWAAAVSGADLVVVGRYVGGRHLGRGLRGSSNKEVWSLTGRHDASELAAVPESELVIAPDGSVTVTGMLAWEGAVGVS